MDSALALKRLTFMVAAATDPVLGDQDVAMLLNASRRVDSAGYSWDSAQWTPTFHLDWAAAEAWAWKAGACSDRYKVIGDGTELNRHQIHQHCVRMYELYSKKASSQPHVLRSHGALVEDRLGAYSTIPWWWELAGN